MDIELQTLRDVLNTNNMAAFMKDPQRNESVFSILTKASFLTSSSFLLEYLPNTLLVVYLGQTGDNTLVEAFGIAFVWLQAFGFGIQNGLSSGLETLVSQAYGANKKDLCSKLYYRSQYASTLFMIPIIILMLNTQSILSWINDKGDMLESAQFVTICMIPSIYLNGIFVNTKVWLNGQHIYDIQMYTQLVSCTLFALFGYVIIVIFNGGLVGCCVARLLLEIVNNLTLAIFYQQKYRNLLLRFSFSDLENTGYFVLSVIPIGSVLWLEWTCFELFTMQASFFTQEIFTAYIILTSFCAFFYQFSYGVSIAATTLVGNEMGAQRPEQAIKYAKGALLIVSTFLLITQVVIYGMKENFTLLLSGNQEVADILENMILFMNVIITFDGLQGVLSGIVRGIGKEKFACATFLFFYLILGQILAHVFSQTLDMGMNGIYYGMMIGTISYDLLQVWNLCQSNWQQLAIEIQSKISHH